jgi:hypothetical protein
VAGKAAVVPAVCRLKEMVVGAFACVVIAALVVWTRGDVTVPPTHASTVTAGEVAMLLGWNVALVEPPVTPVPDVTVEVPVRL